LTIGLGNCGSKMLLSSMNLLKKELYMKEDGYIDEIENINY